MTYQVLARKWRPQDFSSLIGQEPIITALRNGLRENRIAQAYLFSGIRGVGKTTAARILAKALNCERGPNKELPAEDPCNDCPPCIEITAGKDLDVLEVDAATYSKVEQVRELTESLRYGPTRDRFKVVVLDEVHRLSRQAFDALLKIVEEPPPNLVFIFATTENDAVPATILSRCQEFQFRRVASPVMVAYLRHLSENEEIRVSDTALRLIARAGEGSVRDSVALLDQLATFGNGHIDDQTASGLLGGLDTAIFCRLLSSILTGAASSINEIVKEIDANGWDPHNVYGQFITYARDALLLVMGGLPDEVDLPIEEAQSLGQLVEQHSYESLLRLVQHLLASEPVVRRSEFALIALQLAWLRAAELPKLTRIESLLSGRDSLPENGINSAELPEIQSPTKAAQASPTPPASAKKGPTRQSSDSTESSTSSQSANSDQPSPSRAPGPQELRRFRALLAERRQPLAALIDSAELSFSGGQLHITPSPDDPLLAAALQRKNNVSLLDSLMTEIWGQGTIWTLQKPKRIQSPQTEERSEEALKEIKDEPTVKAVLEVFGGNIQSVQ